MKRTRLKRRTPLRKKRKTPLALLKKECDRICREIVFARAGHACERCGRGEKLQWSHIMPRRYKHLIHDPLNAMCLCVGCHLFFWHRNPVDAMAWLTEKRGAEFVKLLRVRAESGAGKPDYEARLLWLRRQAA